MQGDGGGKRCCEREKMSWRVLGFWGGLVVAEVTCIFHLARTLISPLREREREMRRREKREEMAVRTKTNQLLRFVIVRIWTVVSKCLFSSNYYCVLRTSFDLFFLVI